MDTREAQQLIASLRKVAHDAASQRDTGDWEYLSRQEDEIAAELEEGISNLLNRIEKLNTLIDQIQRALKKDAQP